ncbi:34641_t:CDS:2, partial [Gigaspora margarita]
ELIPYKFKRKERLKSNTFYPSFAPLIPDFEAIVRYHGLNKYLLNSYEKQSEISYLILEQKIEIVTKKIFDFIICDEQKQAILNYVQHKKDTFIVIKTGSGKTFCYVIPAILFEGLTAVISPLTALILNQVITGIPCRGLYALSVGTLGRKEKIFQEIAIATCIFEEMILIQKSLHIRENDFTYIYASNQVRSELVYEVKKKYERNGKVFDEIKSLIDEIQEGRAIIYCAHKEECHEVLKELQKRLEDENIDEFFGTMASEDKNQVLERWNHGITQIIITTTAFANLIQQSGCAGRDGLSAKIVVFFTLSDLRTNYCIIAKNKESIAEENDPEAYTYQQYLQREQKKLFEM